MLNFMLFQITYSTKKSSFFKEKQLKIFPSTLPFFPEGLIALALFETVRLNRDNVT